MRLLHARDLVLKKFELSDAPEYAAISHRWTDHEISLQEFQNSKSGHRRGCGWVKIIQGCKIAWRRGINWIWIDTACIDKESSTEMNESINSMYRWYERSKECYVFLPDVHEICACNCRLQDYSIKQVGRRYPRFYLEELKGSVWFTRGWTLQELLAPKKVEFFNSKFLKIGSRQDLKSHVTKITGIAADCLVGERSIDDASLAERMSWAARRRTTREEDVAYSLLGVFGVSMPLLYGEGMRSFMRLQAEIILRSDDESIFAWKPHAVSTDRWYGLLAPNPRVFADTPSIEKRLFESRRHYEWTNKGMRFQLRLPRSGLIPTAQGLMVLLPLNCVQHISKDNGIEEVHQLAVKVSVTADRGNMVLEGKRLKTFESLVLAQDKSIGPTLFPHGAQSEAAGEERHDCPVLLGSPDEDAEEWHIYFAQCNVDRE